MATGSTNVVNTAEGKFTWELAEQFDENEVYYERLIDELDKTNLLGTYILVDKAYIAPLRSSGTAIYGNLSIGSATGSLCFRLEKQHEDLKVSEHFYSCCAVTLEGNKAFIQVYYKEDSGNINNGSFLYTYFSMPAVLCNRYEGEFNYSLLSIYDTSILNNLITFVNLAAVKVSDKVMGVDYDTRAELLELENRTSVTDWINSLITYSKIDLTSSTFIPYKYWIKKPVE